MEHRGQDWFGMDLRVGEVLSKMYLVGYPAKVEPSPGILYGLPLVGGYLASQAKLVLYA